MLSMRWGKLSGLLAFGFLPAFVAVLTLSGSQSRLPDATGKDTVVRVCGACHDAEILAAQKMSRDEWADTISHMVELGAKGSEAEFYQVLDYVSAHFSTKPAKVNVNKAAAKEIETGLLLTAKEAEAVVDYRTKNGNFKSADDLKKVPGLDASKIESVKDRLQFD